MLAVVAVYLASHVVFGGTTTSQNEYEKTVQMLDRGAPREK